MSHMPVNTDPPKQKSTGMSRRWPLGFFLAAIVSFIVGGALVGVWISNASDCFGDSSYYDYSEDDLNCTSKQNGEFYAALAFLIIGAACKFIGWILLIMYCVKRRRSHREAAASMYYTIPMDAQYQPHGPHGGQPPYMPTQYPPQYPAQESYPMHPDSAYQSPAYNSKELPAHYA
ncbi:uncharacterized protein N7443_004046 [Penicillium atrosanguineum]|uniref:Uncharacterized protein n=1 Tax=Penicillium atrosanguineum TaxID=1132637 RepID=A0A9W9Q3W5_9EURO|nr:uncharacterized protein N7443_004046 [Penicillium atrosanguineum]KAJ5304386.1 hypothetical protein N7443_004046 [Penicillium atrosanguineum]KAJ5323859.1 hypothetical protein N7476_002459 [Penicillium atrosanguineum]